jgi:hypothetical protein
VNLPVKPISARPIELRTFFFLGIWRLTGQYPDGLAQRRR